MIFCTYENGTYQLNNLSIEDLDLLQEAIIRLFNESNKAHHRAFRKQVLTINRAIDPELERHNRFQNQ